MLAVLACWVSLAGGAVSASPLKYRPLEMHQMIGMADVCVAGTIVALSEREFTLRIEARSFGDVPAGEIRIYQFRDWACAQRWTPYALGQRCVYFLEARPNAPFHILSGGGEGEMPIEEERVWVRAPYSSAKEALGDFLDECQRFRAHFRFVPGEAGKLLGSQWIERRAFSAEIERYRSSSEAAAFLYEAVGVRYRDVEAVGPPDGTRRIDLGRGLSDALAALPDLDGDGLGEIAYELCGQVWLVHPDRDGRVQRRVLVAEFEAGALAYLGSFDGEVLLAAANHDELRVFGIRSPGEIRSRATLSASDGLLSGGSGPAGELVATLAGLGDLDGDGSFELAVARAEDGGGKKAARVWIVSVGSDGVARGAREFFVDEDAYGLALTAVGDVDGDGVTEVAVSSRGTLRILFLTAAGTVRAETALSSSKNSRRSFLSAIGDWNGDQVPDLAASVSPHLVRVLFLKRDGALLSESEREFPNVGLETVQARVVPWEVGSRRILLASGLSYYEKRGPHGMAALWVLETAETKPPLPR